MKINGSVAREVLKNLEEEGLIKKVVSHARLVVYSKLCVPDLEVEGETNICCSTSGRWCGLIDSNEVERRKYNTLVTG